MKSLKFSQHAIVFIVEYYSDNEIHAIYLEADTFMTSNLIDLLCPQLLSDIQKEVNESNRPSYV